MEKQELTDKEKEKGRSLDYYNKSSREQWEEDKELGILDWEGS